MFYSIQFTDPVDLFTNKAHECAHQDLNQGNLPLSLLRIAKVYVMNDQQEEFQRTVAQILNGITFDFNPTRAINLLLKVAKLHILNGDIEAAFQVIDNIFRENYSSVEEELFLSLADLITRAMSISDNPPTALIQEKIQGIEKEEYREALYDSLAHSLISLGKLQEAAEIIKTLEDQSFINSSFTEKAAVNYIEQGNYEKAYEEIDQLESLPHQISILLTIGIKESNLFKASQFSKEIFSDAISKVRERNFDDHQFDDLLLGEIAKAQASCGLYEDADDTLAMIPHQRLKEHMTALVQKEKINRDVKSFLEMPSYNTEQIVEKIMEYSVDNRSYAIGVAAHFFLTKKRPQDALAIFQQIPDLEYYDEYTLPILSDTFTLLKDHETAMRVATFITSNQGNVRDAQISKVLIEWAFNEMKVDPFAELNKIETISFRVHTFMTVAINDAIQGRYDQAVYLLEKVQNLTARCKFYTEVATKIIQHRKIGKL